MYMHPPEKVDKTIDLDQHADGRPAQEHHHDAPNEGPWPSQFVLLEEKSERSLKSDDKG